MRINDGRTEAQREADRQRGARSTEQGAWGEAVACRFLERKGLEVLERNVHPCARDLRCEVDVIAYAARENRVIFVEVKTHAQRSPYAGRLWAVDRRKKDNLLRACSSWVMRRKWHGAYRFDVIEVYGSRDSDIPPEVDHIENVPLFPAKWRFWR